MDAGDLVVRRHEIFILGLEVPEAQDVEVELVRVVPLEIPELPAERHSSYSGQVLVTSAQQQMV
jgi:hypothetical protein